VPATGSRSKPATGHRYGGSVGSGKGRSVSYGDADGALLQRVVCAVTDAGDAITFGRTSERGAYYVGVLSSGMLERFYLDSVEALTACLEGIASAGEALVE
jgi:hypothetical protein